MNAFGLHFYTSYSHIRICISNFTCSIASFWIQRTTEIKFNIWLFQTSSSILFFRQQLGNLILNWYQVSNKLPQSKKYGHLDVASMHAGNFLKSNRENSQSMLPKILPNIYVTWTVLQKTFSDESEVFGTVIREPFVETN